MPATVFNQPAHRYNEQIEIRIAIYDLSSSQPENFQSEPEALMQPVNPKPHSPLALPLPPSLDGLRVLVVEDEAAICAWIERVTQLAKQTSTLDRGL